MKSIVRTLCRSNYFFSAQTSLGWSNNCFSAQTSLASPTSGFAQIDTQRGLGYVACAYGVWVRILLVRWHIANETGVDQINEGSRPTPIDTQSRY